MLAVIVALAAWSLHNYVSVRDFGQPSPGATAPTQEASEAENKEAAAKEGESPPDSAQGAENGGASKSPGSDNSGSSDSAGSDNSTSRFIYVYVIPFLVLAGGVWTSFRIIQWPLFADFLISVEGEMNKVSWPARNELLRASVVVMFVIFFLAFILFAYDYVLAFVMNGIEWFLNRVTAFFRS